MDPAAFLNVMITDDGNTLLTVRKGNDGSLELLITPVTIVQNNSDDSLELLKDPNNDIIVNQSLQLKLNSFLSNTTQQHNLSPIEILDFESSDFHVYNENTCQSTEAINNILHKNLKYNSSSGMQIGTEVSQTGVEQNLEKTHVAAPQETSICLEKFTSPKKHAHKGQKGPKKCKKTPDKEECFKCDVCGQEFKKQYLKQKHMHEHTQEKPHHCPKCPASFNIPTNFTLHMATHNIGEPKCPECGRKFARMASLKSHMIAHELDENLYCTECDDVFETRAQLDNHLKLHNEKCSNDEYKKCKICRKQFTQPVLYLQHLRDHYKLQMKSTKQTRRGIRHRTTYKCRLCLKAFEKPSQLARHIRVHTGEKPYKCNLCNRSFTQKGSVRIHMWQHNGIRPYSCSFCNAKFSQKGNLNAHVLRAHKVQEGSPMYRCTQCPCIFKKLGSLNGHMKRAHSDTKSRNADDEGLKEEANEEEVRADPVFNERCVNEDNQDNVENNAGDELTKNFEEGFVVTDNSEQTAVVTLLDKMSNDAKGKYIKIKQRFVNNSRLYECSFCDKTFKKPSDLMRHLRIHTLEKPFKCNTCSRSFTLKSTMLSHERTHTSTIKYPCSKCDKFFKSAKALASHEKIHSTTCSFCDQEFSTFDELKEHSTMHVDSMKHRSKDSQKNKYTPEVQNLAPKVILKEPLVLTELSSGLLRAQPKFRNEIAHGQFRPHKCPACPAAFMKLSHLKQHHRKHTGERPFMCTLCNRTFSTNSALKTHRRIHESSKPYKCSICNTHFSTLSSMKRHRFTHSNKRPYMCPYCNKTFKTTVNCRKHMKIHKQEIAQQQLELQKKQKQQSVAIDSPTNRLTTMTTTQPIIMNDQEITFQPISNNLTQDLNDQLQTLMKDNKSFLGVSPTSQNNNVTEQNIPIVENPNICTTQTLHADETGTVTLSNYTGDQTLTPESIREIEETLNQQLFSIGMNLALNSTVRQIEQQNNSPFQTRDQPVLSIIYDNGKTLESPLNQCVNSNVFSSQFDTFDMNQITLQADHELDMAIAQANSTNMTNILTNSNQENQHYNPEFINNNFETNLVLGQNDLNRNSQINNSTVFNEKKQSSNVQTDKDLSKENNLQCHICNVGQFNAEDLKQHLKTHQGSRKFECSYCHSKFCTSGGLSRHVKIHESQETHKCYECKQEFSTTLQLREHIKEHVKNELKLKNLTEFDDISTNAKSKNNEAGDKKSNECQYCSKTFRKPSDLVRHLRTHTGERPYQCQYCNKSFAVKCTLDSHLKIHSGEKSFYCHVCSTMFASKGSLKVHMRLHTGDKPFDCSMCNMKFRTSGHRKVHMRSHARELNKAVESESKKQPISTATQNDQSGQLQDNGNAQILHTIAEPQQITQQIGGHDQNLGPITINSVSDQITFNTDGTTLNDTTELVTLNDDNQLVANLPFFLANGLVTIKMEDPAISSQLQLTSTELVDNEFVSTNISEKLNDQMHGPQVIFTSEVPNDGSGVTDANQFSLNNCLVLQLDNVDSTMPDTTTGNSPKQTKALSTATRRECDICGKAFAKPCQVERHKRVHTGERPFQCDLCNKNFSQKSSLQMHRKRHTGDRPYPCSQCDRTFIQSGNLQTHLKRVHKIDPAEIKRLIKGQQFVNYSPKLLEQDIEDNRVLGFDDFSIGELLE